MMRHTPNQSIQSGRAASRLPCTHSMCGPPLISDVEAVEKVPQL